MNINNYNCAKRINYLFKQLHQNYVEMVFYLNDLNHLIVPWQKAHQWLDGENDNSPVKALNIYYSIWANEIVNFVDQEFEREIELNLSQSDEGYFSYMDNTFSKYWSFVQNFKDLLLMYVNDNDTAIAIKGKLYYLPEKFNKHDFKAAIELQLIYIFDQWEALYKKYNSNYERYFKDGEFLRLYKPNPDYIQLGYGKSNTDAIKLIYQALTDSKILTCDFKEFEAHFDPFASPAPNPIVWSGTDAQLLVLFLGKDFQDDDNLPNGNYQLKLKKQVTPEQILGHFKLGETTTVLTLRSNHANMFKRKTIKKPRPIKLLIHDLNLLATH